MQQHGNLHAPLNHKSHSAIARLIRATLALATVLAPIGAIFKSPAAVFAAEIPSASSTPIPDNMPFIGTTQAFYVSFANPGDLTGYGPYALVELPQGISYASASYLGTTITPIAPTPAICAAGIFTNPLTGLGSSCAPGNRLLVLQYPFGSFTVGQPTAVIQLNTTIGTSPTLVGASLVVTTTGGYIYGNSPTGNTPTLGTPVTTTVIPTLYRLRKDYLGSEDETATGPNFPRTFRLTAEIAPGQTISNFRITDTLPNNIVVLNTPAFSFSPATASLSVPPTYTVPANGNTFTALWPSVSGGAGPGVGSVTLDFPFYVSRTNASGANVLNATTGALTQSVNAGNSSGLWAQGAVTVTSNTATETLADKSVAIQKSVASSNGSNLPGTTLTYTLNWQVSDFFTVGDIVITDTFDNAQDYVYGSPVFTVNDRNTSISSVAFPVTNTTVTTNSDGSITLVYNVSAAMVALGQADGILQGGLITTTNYGATTGVLQFRTTVRDLYRAPGPPTGPLQPNDTANNSVTIGASIRNNSLITSSTGYQTDASAAGVLIQPGQLFKSIYAINGNTALPSPVTVKPDDAVTYRLRYDIPIGDFSVLRIYDYLPLPIFTASTMVYSDSIEFTAAAPAIGEWSYGPASASSVARLPVGAGVTVTVNSAANSIAWDFGGRSDSTNTSTTVDLLFTVRATNAPMADGLYLTNQARTQQINAAGSQTIADNIVQIQIREPSVAIRKGVIGVYNGPGNAAPDDPAPGASLNPTQTLPLGVTYTPGNVCSARFNTTITSTMLAQTPRPFDSDALNADAGDRATFAIVLENVGSAPAYGVTLSDTLPAGYTYVPGSLCMQTGGGALVDTTTPTPTALLGGSVTISGTIDEGRARGSQALTNTTGSNIIIVTYDAIVDAATSHNKTLVNTTNILSYTNSATGENMLTFTPLADRTDTASLGTHPLEMAKSLDSTEISATNNSLASQAAIGELITYTLHITVPEGSLPNLVITDAMDSNSGLAFVDCVDINASAGLASTIGSFSLACADGATVNDNPRISNNGRTAVWNLGSILNSDTDNSVTETITIQYMAVVRDIAGIVSGSALNNRVSATYGDTSVTTIPQFSASTVSVVEPSLSQSKSNTPGIGDAGDTITYTIAVTNTSGRAPAYNVVVTDTFPAKLIFTPGSVQATPEFNVVSSTAMLTATFGMIAPGATARITFTGVLSESVNPTELIVNNANARGTSLPDLETAPRSTYDITNTVERGANSSNSTYVTSATSNASVQAMTLSKSLVSTEISTTGNTNTQATVGELVTYTLAVVVPEGTSANVRLTDTMSSTGGLIFVDCVDISAPDSVSSSIGPISNACLDGTTGSDNPVVSGSGQTATWNLGTLVNTDTDNAVTETVRITYTAVVRNFTGNVNSTSLTNRASGTYGSGNTLAQVSAANITVVEQNLSQSKASSPTTGDAGDTITYTLVVTNASGRAPAYDVVITDAFPSKFVYNTASFASTPDSSVISTSAGLTATFAVITPGTTARITVTGILSVAINPTEVITNRTGVAGTSLPGLAATPRSTYDTLSSTERISNSSNSTYLTSAQSSVTAPAMTLGKALVSTEISTTGNTNAQATVGELITYTLLITVAEGTSTNVRVTDTMASSSRLAFVDCVDISAPDSVSSSIGAISNACLDGTTGSDNPVVSGSGQTVAWNLGTLVNTDTDNAVTETVRITYTAVVRNIAGNVNATTLTNRASGTYGTSNTLAQVSATTITITEQSLSQSKASSPSTGDAGDTITYTLVVTNASGRAPAYDVVITDAFPSKFVYNTASFASTPDSSVISTSAGLTATFAVITPGTTARITVTGILSVAVIPSEVITNTTGVSGTSLPGLAGVSRSTYDSANTSERTLNSSNSTYVTTASSPETINAPAIAKTLVGSEISNTVNGATQAVIGEKLTYRLVLNAPEGTMPSARITDTLPSGLAYVTCNSIDAAAEITTSVVGGFAGVCNGTTAPTVSSPGQTITFNLGTLTNSADSNGATEQITITYDAIVLNIAGNQTGTLLNNSAQYGWNGRALSAVNAGNVRVIEPLMGVLKSVAPPQPTTSDAGDTITYTVVITGPSGADGNDVQLYDTLPKTASGSLILSPTIVSAVAAPNSPAISSSDFAISGDNDNGWTLTTASSLDLPANISRRITVTLAGTLPSYVAPGSTFTNTAVLSYTTIDGVGSGVQRSAFNTSSTERDGSGGINDYTTNNSAALNVTQVVPQKLIMATSEQATATGVDGNPRVAIGEVIQYRVVITMSEGTAATFSIKDNLPTGLSYVSGSARVGFVASYGAGAGITSTAITPADTGCAALNITAGDIASVPSSSITCPIPSGRISLDGSNNPTFDFGTVANFDTDTDNEYLVVEFQAVAQNIAGNTAGTQRANTATTTVNGQSLGATSPVTVTMAEPSLTLRKSVSAPSPLDAGDRVTFTIVYTNGTGANLSPAFDAVITDVLDSNLTLDSVSLNAPTPAVGYTSASNSIVTDSGRLTVTVAQLDPGGVVTITALAHLNSDVASGRRITNTGYLAYTSLPTDTGTINGSFLGTPGAAGSSTGERTGTGGVNGYSANSTVTLTATTPTIVKTSGSPTQYSIGAPIYYSLTVTLPEGVATNVSVLDDLPTGLTYVSSQLVTSAAASGGLLSADYDGTIVGPVITQPNGDALFAFGNITTTADNTANNTFVIQVLARIANSPTNQQAGGTAIFQNTARLTYTHAISGATGLSNGPITVWLLEPRVVAQKRVTPSSGVQAGDTLTYEVTLTNTGSSVAYDTTLTDTLPAGLDGASVAAVTLDNAASSSTLSGSAPNLSFGEWDIPVNSVLRLTYTVRVLDGFVIDGAYTNTVDADWTSTDGVNGNERLYDDNNSYNYDGSQDTATATFASNGVTLAKSDGGVTTAAIGSVIRYTLTVNSPLGTLRDLRITDTLPAGLSYVGNAAFSGNIAPQPSAVTSSQNVIWTFGNAVISPTGSVTLAFDARVLDTAGNDSGNSKTNNATLTHVAVTGTLRTRNASDGFSIVEPRIAAGKRVTPGGGAQAGDTLTYVVTLTNTGTSTAYETTFTDTLPAGLDGASVVAAALNGTAVSTTLSGSAPNLSFGTWDMAVNSVLQVTYSVRITDGFVIDGAYTNTVDADWTSLDGVDASERVYNDTTVYTVDGSQDTATAVFTSNGVTLSKSDGGVTTAAIGSVIRYTLTVNSPLGTVLDLRITDTLPTGMSYAGNAAFSGNISPQPSASASGQNVVWTFGNAVITPTGSVTLAFDAHIDDNLGNDTGMTRTNVVTLTHLAVTGTLRTRTGSDGFTIAEPRIAAAKRVAPSSGAQAGDTLTYRVTLTNTGTSTAYETTFTDTLPAGLDGASIDAATLDGSTVSASLSGSAPNLSFGEWDIPVNAVLQVTYTVRVLDSFVLDGAYTNTVDADWTSVDGIDPNERIYNDTTAYSVDGTQDAATAVFTSNGVTLSKTDGGVTTVQIGSIVRYTLTVNSPLGTLRDLRITDTLPAGMSYIGNAAFSGNIAPQPTAVTSSQNLIWTFGNAVISPTGSVTLAFDARVLDTAGNDSGSLKTNNATLTHVAVTGTLRTRTDSDSFTIAEPRIAVGKRVTPLSGVQAGDTLTYVVTLTNTGTNPAYETTFTDTLPAGLDGAGVVAATLDGSAIAASVSGSAPNLSFGTWDMAVNSVLHVTYTVRITDGFALDGAYTNTVDADWTSLDGVDANERIYNDTTVYTVDGTQDTATAVFTSNGVTFSKSDGGVIAAGIGSVVRYTLTVNSPLGTLRDLRITDTLPAGMSYAGGVAFTGNIAPQPSPSAVGQNVVWSFGDAVITPTGSVTLAFDAVIDDVAGNSDGGGKTNNATLTHVAVTGTLRTRTDNDSLTLIEPALVISKRVQTPDALIGNGDLLTYTLLLTNTGNAAAYNVRITDSLPVSITFFSTEQLSVTNSAVTSDTNASFDQNLAWTVSSLNAGGSITVVYRALVLGGVPYNTVLTNTAAALFASAPGITPTRHYTTPVVNANVRSASPQLQMVKTSPLSSVAPAGLLTYTILFTNTGIVDAVGVVITDRVPLSTSFVSADSGGTESGGIVTWTIPSFSPGAPGSLQMVVRVAPTLLNGTNIVNTAYITSTDGGIITPTSTLTTPVVSAHALHIEKTVSPVTAAPGDIVTYTVVYTVSGDEPAFGVTITDVLPNGLTFVAGNPASRSRIGQTTIWAVGAFSPTASTPVTGSIVFSAQLTSTPTLSGTSFVNTIDIGDSAGITDTDTARVTVDSSHALAISKWTEQIIATAGTQVTYTVAYTVTGDEPSLNTTVSDSLPEGVSFVSATPSASISSSTAATWSLGTLVPNASGVITVVGLLASDIAPGTVLTNSAAITDAQSLSATAAATNTVIALSDPTILKLGAPDPVVSGGIVTYTLVFTNNGPSDAQNVVLTDTLPSDVSWNGGFTTNVPVTRTSAAPLAWLLGALRAGDFGRIVFTGTVSNAANYSITNQVVITTSTPDSDGDNNTSSVTLGVNYADVYVFKSVEPAAPVRPGDTITWTLRYGNEGQAAARNVSISDTLPAGITWGGEYTSTDTPLLSAAAPQLTWDLGALAVGASGEIVFTATVDSAVTANVVFTNNVRIDTTTPQTDTLDDTSHATASKLDLIVSKITPLPVVDIYDTVSFTLVFTNVGGVTITTMPVTDTYDPAVLEFVSASPTQSSATPGYLEWVAVSLIEPGPSALESGSSRFGREAIGDLVPLGPGESISIVVNFRALTSTFGGVTTNTVAVIGSRDGVTLPLRSADAAVRVVAPNLDAIKLSPGNAQAGAVLSYTILITNSGDGAATNVSVLDSATLAGASLGTVQLVSPSLTIAAGATATLSYPLNVPVPVTNGVQLVNTISVTATESITPLISTVTDTVASTHTLALSKSAVLATARPGELITYTIYYTLAGNEPVTQVVIGDALPLFVTYVSSTPGGNYNAFTRAIDWIVNDPLVYASGITQRMGAIEVVVRADLPLTNGLQLVNTAVAADSGGLTATASVPVNIVSSSELRLDKSVAQSVTQPGGLLTYTLAYTITGDQPLHGVAITDVLAPHLSYVSAVPPGSDNGGVVTWFIGDVPTDTAGTITLIARVNNVLAPTLDHIDNEATLGESTGTIVTDSVPVALATDLTLRKEADPVVVPAGGLVTYTFIASNLGPVDAHGVVVHDPLPAAMTGVSASANCTLTPALNCVIGDLLVGAESRVTVTVRLASGYSGTLINTAHVTAATPEIDLTNNDATAQVATSLPGLALSKSISRGDGRPVRVRDVVEYTLILTNTGNLDALDLALTDLVPTGTVYVNDSASPAAELVNRTLMWRIARLAPGETFTARFQIMVDSVSVGLVLRNTAHVSTGDVNVISSNTVINPYQPTAITLDRFEATRTGGAVVEIRFDTSLEQNSSGFYIVRASTSDRQSATRVSEFIQSRGIGGGASYSWTDTSAPANGEVFYWLEEIETGGASMFYGPVLATTPRGPQSWRVFMPIVQK